MQRMSKQKVVVAILLGVMGLFFITTVATAQTAAANPSDLQELYENYNAQLEKSKKLAEIEANKVEFVKELAARWQGAALAAGNDETWYDRAILILENENPEILLQMSEAATWEEFTDNFGNETTSQLVYYPLTPCRVVDTRLATRWGALHPPIAANGNISFDVIGGTFATQGGAAADCGVLSSAAGVVVNVTAVPVDMGGVGFGTVYPYLSSLPTASTINWYQRPIANAVVLRNCYLCADDLTFFASRSTHLVVDVIGYFARNSATAVDQYVVRSDTTVANNTNVNLFSPACPAGYRVTGGGHYQAFYQTPGIVLITRPAAGTSYTQVSGANVADRWFCQGRNTTGSSQTVSCYAICSRIPGR